MLDEHALVADIHATERSNIHLPYTAPLARAAVGDTRAELYVQLVTRGQHDVHSLIVCVETCLKNGGFPLLAEGKMEGRHVKQNYKSAYEGADRVSEALRKRLTRGQTKGPYRVRDVHNIALPHYAVNAMGAVPKKGSDALRPVDDALINDG